MSFDYRSRQTADIQPATMDVFHRQQFPAIEAQRKILAAQALAVSTLNGFTLAVENEVWTWKLDAGGELNIVQGDSGEFPRADLSADWFSDIVNDVRSTVAVMIANAAVMTRGHIGHLISFEPTLRALLDGRHAWQPELVEFKSRAGEVLDLHQSFTLEDDPEELAHFLDQAGFLHIKSVFSKSEIAQLRDEMDYWFAQMTPTDNRAWYARTTQGEDICVRVTNLPKEDLRFPFTERLASIAALSKDLGRTHAGTDFLYKPLEVAEGISDLPWHKDCELGGHSYWCSSMIVGTSLTASGPDNGQLGVLAGSHRVSVTMLDVERVDLPEVYLSTEPGDVTVHLSCVLHRATAPRRSPRRVTYSNLALPGDRTLIDAKIRAVRDQAGRDTFAPN